MPRPSVDRIRLSVFVVVLAGFCPTLASGQTRTSPPPSQDDQLRLKLGLGRSSGCFNLLGVGDSGIEVANALALLGPLIGNELRAICLPSAVASASSQGGGFQSFQPTRIETQFDTVRTRIDQRVQGKTTPKPAKPPIKKDVSFGLGWPSTTQDPELRFRAPDGAGVFGELAFVARDRVGTNYESAYDSNMTDFTVGADFARGGGMVGGWIARNSQSGEFTEFGALVNESASTGNAAVLARPGVLEKTCGGLANGGSFDQRSTSVGGFGGFVGSAGFVDAAYGWTRREHDYARSVCAIEFQGTLDSDLNGNLTSSVGDLDDIFAGVMRGSSSTAETSFSVRGGASVGNAAVTVGPRAIFTLTRAKTGAYAETGRSTVANRVRPVEGPDITRQLNGPIGFELAFDEQSRTSMLLETGGEIAVHLGAVSPHFSGYWRHEFKDDFHLVTAHLAQDRRLDPGLLTFGHDAFDPDSFRFAFGATAIAGNRFAARVEIRQPVSDLLFKGRTVSFQARLRF